MMQQKEIKLEKDINDIKIEVRLMADMIKNLLDLRNRKETMSDDTLSDDDMEALSELAHEKKHKKLLSLKYVEKELGLKF